MHLRLFVTVVDEQTLNPCDIDLLFTEDFNGLNAGSFFLRNTPLVSSFVDFYSDPVLISHADKNWLLRDQDLLLHLLARHPSIYKRTGWVDQRVFNSYAGNWERGDLVVHFVSCGYVTVLEGP
jgi:hypothetical protein